MNYLNVDFLASKGIVATKPLRDWLTRVSFVAKTRGNPHEAERYAKWALCTIEDHLAKENGTDVEWKSVPTVMPAKVEHREPKMLSADPVAADPVAADTAHANDIDYRSALYKEGMGRAPPELKRFLNQAFELYDKDVAKGKRHYKQVSFMEMLNIARNLEKMEKSEKIKAALHTSDRTAGASAPVPAPAAAPAAGSKSTFTVVGAGRTSNTPAEKRQRGDPPGPPANRMGATASDDTVERQNKKKVKGEATTPEASECATFFHNIISRDYAFKEKEYRVFTANSGELERRYSRCEPTEEDIRPLHVLERSFDFIVGKSREKERQENRMNALKYLSDQLKGMRQDLRVQNIVNDFTVMVYESHARICLEAGDIGEFNQCQASLKSFYEYRSVDKCKCHVAEFFVYRLVYLSLSKQYDSLSTELIEYTNTRTLGQCAVMKEFLPTPERMQHVLQLIVAFDNGDAISALQLLFLFKKELQFLVQIYLPRMRVHWLYSMLCGIRGNISLRFIMSNLGFLPAVQDEGESHRTEGALLLWMDGDKDMAQKKFHDLFRTLKISLPSEFVFENELVVGHSTGMFLDASVALQQVQEYIQYLGTRNDAQI